MRRPLTSLAMAAIAGIALHAQDGPVTHAVAPHAANRSVFQVSQTPPTGASADSTPLTLQAALTQARANSQQLRSAEIGRASCRERVFGYV